MKKHGSGTLPGGVPHPAAQYALRWVEQKSIKELMLWAEAFASTAIDGRTSSEVCSETLRRVMAGEPVSDRYILGLAWTMLAHDL